VIGRAPHRMNRTPVFRIALGELGTNPPLSEVEYQEDDVLTIDRPTQGQGAPRQSADKRFSRPEASDEMLNAALPRERLMINSAGGDGETAGQRVLSEEPFCSEAEQPDPAGSRNDRGDHGSDFDEQFGYGREPGSKASCQSHTRDKCLDTPYCVKFRLCGGFGHAMSGFPVAVQRHWFDSGLTRSDFSSWGAAEC
jgi:hypothetical protein